MTNKLIPNFILGAVCATALISCGDREVQPSMTTTTPSTTDPVVLVDPMTEQNKQIRDETINELLSIKSEVRKTIDENNQAESLDGFITDLESLRPRLEYIHMRTADST